MYILGQFAENYLCKANWLTDTCLGVTLATNLLKSTCLDVILRAIGSKRYLFIKQCLNVPLPTNLLKDTSLGVRFRPICEKVPI